jgi:copper chaperone CopZ
MIGKRWLLVFCIMIFLTGSFLTRAAHSRILEVTITVEGLACPFCAYGIEKKLKRVEGVRSINIEMNRGIVVLAAEKDRSVNIREVPGAVKDSGFSLGRMKVRVTGIARRDGGKFLLQYGGSDELFFVGDMKTDRKKQFSEYIKSGKTVEAEGVIQKGPEKVWTLYPESLKGISP